MYSGIGLLLNEKRTLNYAWGFFTFSPGNCIAHNWDGATLQTCCNKPAVHNASRSSSRRYISGWDLVLFTNDMIWILHGQIYMMLNFSLTASTSKPCICPDRFKAVWNVGWRGRKPHIQWSASGALHLINIIGVLWQQPYCMAERQRKEIKFFYPSFTDKERKKESRLNSEKINLLNP